MPYSIFTLNTYRFHSCFKKVFVCLALSIGLSTAQAENSFVILQYHHVSEDTPRVTSVSPAEFEAHMAYLAENNKVIALDEALRKLKNNEAFAERTVAITFDDGYKNILENGHPILQRYNFPYTIFINPAEISNSSVQLTWDEVKNMSEQGVLFANHTLDHLHLLDRYANEDDKAWLARIKNNIEQAETMLTEKLGYSLKWLAYPFGEYSNEVKSLLAEMGYIGFGQQSGAVGPKSDLQALPRYPAAGRYANLDTLKTKINSLAMPVTAVSPNKVVMLIEEKLNTVKIDVAFEDFSATQVACYFRGKSLAIKETSTGFSFDMNATFYPGRTRVNCTAPSKKDGSRYYWYSIPFFTAQDNGKYLD